MPIKPDRRLARRVVTGVGADGRSVVVSDMVTPTWVQRPTGSVVMEIWRTDSIPAHVDDFPSEDGEWVMAPPEHGVCVRLAVFPADKDIDAEKAAAYEASLHELYGDQGNDAHNGTPGMHRTDTIDVVTVLDGEIWLVLEHGETLLRTGDTLVQRGTRHAWSNRSDRACTLSSTQFLTARD